MACIRPALSLLGTAPRAVTVGREVDLHHGKRLRRVGRARWRWQGVRLRSDHVPARLPHAAPACDRRRRTGEWVLPLECTGQLRMDLWLRQPLRADLCGFPDAEADAEAKRVILPRNGAPQRCRVRVANHASDTTSAGITCYYDVRCAF